MNWLRALTVSKPAAQTDGSLKVVVGGSYPSIYGYDPDTLTVTRLVEFNGSITVYYKTQRGHSNADNLDTFCRDIARRIAYERNTIQSVDVTEYFARYGITAKEAK